MKIPISCFALLSLLTPLAGLAGQESDATGNESPEMEAPVEAAESWQVDIPADIQTDAPAEEPQEPDMIDFEVLNSRSEYLYVRQEPEFEDLPLIEGMITLTIQEVENPGLPDPATPATEIITVDPAATALLQEAHEAFNPTDWVFVSATVYMKEDDADNVRTLLRVCVDGNFDQGGVAWSNINFLHLSNQAGYSVNLPDGTIQDIGLQMTCHEVYTEGNGVDQNSPQIPDVDDLAINGPEFFIVEGGEDGPVKDRLEQIHDLYRKAGQDFKEQFLALEAAREERKAFLLLNPPKPEDVTIRVWSRTEGDKHGEVTP